jgi:tripartite-type tricarboxylate transporter receptor subunit TctC
MLKKFIFGASIAIAALTTNAQSITVPEQLRGKTVTVIIPYAPGGDTDATQRFMGEQAKKLTGLNFVFINRPGANTVIGSNEAATKPADGLTLFGGDSSTHVFNPALDVANHTDPKLLQPISVFSITPQAFFSGANSPIKDLKDLVAYARANPKTNFGCSATHACLYQTVFYNTVGAEHVNQVNYKTAPETIIAAAQGDILTFTASVSSIMPHVQSGRLKAVAVGWHETVPGWPDVRPVSDVIKGFRAINFQMISTPAGTPRDIVEFWNTVYRTIAATPEVQARFQQLFAINTLYTVKQTEQFLTTELAYIRQLAKSVKK